MFRLIVKNLSTSVEFHVQGKNNFNFQKSPKQKKKLIEPNLFHFIPVLFLDRDSILKEKEKKAKIHKNKFSAHFTPTSKPTTISSALRGRRRKSSGGILSKLN